MKITEEQINRANMVNLPSFLISNGFPLKKAGREFVWQEHDSLHIKDIAPPTKPCRQILGIKKISLRQKNLKCDSIPAFFFLDKFPFCFRLFGKV